MDHPRAFRRRLAASIVGLVGGAAVASCSPGAAGPSTEAEDGGAHEAGAHEAGVPEAGPPEAGVPEAGSGAGGSASAGAGGAGGAGGGGGSAPVLECFAWGADAGACPTNHIAVLDQFLANGCPTDGWTPYKVDSGPTVEPGQCCYMVELFLCPGGGRPFLVDGRPVVAQTEAGGAGRGWVEDVAARGPQVEDLAPEARAALAGAWAEDALLEHASVASFSRLSLALLAAGAPADLVAGAHRAALDEVRHARLCFALASAYAGDEIAPGPFPLGHDVRLDAGLCALVASTVREGCVGETVAAVTAAEQRAAAQDPAVRAALGEIAEDEARHAELAWQIVAWAVRAGGREVREAAARALVEAIEGAWRGAAAGHAGDDAALHAHGRLGGAEAANAVRSALAEVVAPCARALLTPGARFASAIAP